MLSATHRLRCAVGNRTMPLGRKAGHKDSLQIPSPRIKNLHDQPVMQVFVFGKRSSHSSATAPHPSSTAIPCLLPLAEKFFIAHRGLVRMCAFHMLQISAVLWQTHHQPHGLPEVSSGLCNFIQHACSFQPCGNALLGSDSNGVSLALGRFAPRAEMIVLMPNTRTLTTTTRKIPANVAST
jgi:hypothetical protein